MRQIWQEIKIFRFAPLSPFEINSKYLFCRKSKITELPHHCPLKFFLSKRNFSFHSKSRLQIWEPIAVETHVHQPPSLPVLDHVVHPQHVLEDQPFLVCHIQTRRNVTSSTESANRLLDIAVARMLYMNALIKTQPSYFFEYLKSVVTVHDIVPRLLI